MYVGTDQLCCFVETFGDELIGQRAVTQATLKNRNPYTIFLKKKNKISVVNLSADGPLQIGLDDRICSGEDYGICRQWATAFMKNENQYDGLYYPVRHDKSRFGIALFARSSTSEDFEVIDHGALWDNEELIRNAILTYKFAVL